MNKLLLSTLYWGFSLFVLNQTAIANSQDLLYKITQPGLQTATTILLAVGIVDRVDRRINRRDNASDRVDDKQKFHEQRRDCSAEGADCRADNRQSKRHDTVEHAEERVDDRRERRF